MPIPILDLANLGIGLINKIPTGKGKRKMAAEFLNAAANDLALLMGDLEAAANSGEVLSGFSLKMVNAQLRSTLASMRTTVDAIGPDDIKDE